ncbi:hypothetical protein VIS19158_00395 [Vibrio scophthalmi LMG 19158]|uniref:Uncharacterized protein n=1 Tax=Vibrio scophthalmi LMG 19158 TaxID=870967 RepID=F9RMM2_9VIBR|nr:hypothetical protein VIS19158_00395 [Vibrio scophthalmi LMG 19158]
MGVASLTLAKLLRLVAAAIVLLASKATFALLLYPASEKIHLFLFK